jgi:hypothetical protein
LLAVGALLPSVAGKALGKRGLAQGRLVSDWPTLVGADIARHTAPERLAFSPGRREDGTLHLVVDGPWAVELQHLAPQVIERINGYFGYRAVARLKMRRGVLPREPGEPDDPPRLDEAERSRIESETAVVADHDLRRALADFGAALKTSRPGARKR